MMKHPFHRQLLLLFFPFKNYFFNNLKFIFKFSIFLNLFFNILNHFFNCFTEFCCFLSNTFCRYLLSTKLELGARGWCTVVWSVLCNGLGQMGLEREGIRLPGPCILEVAVPTRGFAAGFRLGWWVGRSVLWPVSA